MKFIDRTEIHIKAGRGGDGLVSFKSAKNMPKLGADGGDGGHGGDVVLVGHKQLNTLSSLRYRHYYMADDGKKGGNNGKTGACGKPLRLKVPIGTIIHDRETGELLGEVLEDGEVVTVAEGGRRGLGNMRFVKPTRQAPEFSISGTKGAQKTLALELKLIADIGLAGFPNAGKSSLISAISSARPRVADYPFTTLVPHLGVVDFRDEGDVSGRSFVMADIPGLISGAAEGKGLGHDFLRHLERTKVLAYVVECTNLNGDDPLEVFQQVKKEIESYGSDLESKPYFVVVSKTDLLDDPAELDTIIDSLTSYGVPKERILPVSSAAREGLTALKRTLMEFVESINERSEQEVVTDSPAVEDSRDLSESSLEEGGFTLMSRADFLASRSAPQNETHAST